MRKILMLCLITFLLFADCNKRLFTLKIDTPIPLKDIISDISSQCNLTIIVTDKYASNILKSNLNYINVVNEPLNDLLNIIFSSKNLFYKIENNVLYISYFKTKTFKINYIPSSISGDTIYGSEGNTSSGSNNLQTNYSFDFWNDLKNNLKNILKNTSDFYKPPVIDKNAGLVTITGTREQINQIKSYLKTLNERLRKEILIDVHIYSVELSSSHKMGIDWSQLSLSLGKVYDKGANKFLDNPASVPLRAQNIFGSESIFNAATFNVSAFLNFLAQNGNVNSISNPKIVTLNSQKAIISIGDTIYYKYASNITTDNNGNPTTSYTIDSKFVGVVLDITPQISDDGEIILSINPKISAFKNLNQLNNTQRDMPPDTKDDTLMSVVKLKNNETLVLGGLITNDSELQVNGVPVLKEIPLINYLFSSREKITSRKELVFVITPHIIDLNSKKTLKDYGYKKLPSLEDLNVR